MALEEEYVLAEEQRSVVVPEILERFVKQLLVAYKAVMLYPPLSAIPLETGGTAVELLRQALAEDPEIRIAFGKDGLYYAEHPVFPDHAAFATLAQAFYNRGVADVRFHAAMSAIDITGFLGMLRLSPSEIVAAGGFETALWTEGVDSITITESRVQIVDELGGEPETPGVSADDVARMLDDHLAGRPVEHRVLVRVAGDRVALRAYLAASISSRDSVDAVRISELARLAAAQPIGDRPELFRALAEAIGDLDPAMKRALVAERILPEARTDDALASVIRQMDVDEVCRMLVEGLECGSVSREGVARAIRNLALISMADRSDVIAAAGAAMRGAGVEEEAVGQVLGLASPTMLTVREVAVSRTDTQRPVDAIFRLMDLAPGSSVQQEDDPAIEALKREARLGIGDGDILDCLVALVTVDADSERWTAIMATLESSLELLVARGEFGLASDAARQLEEAAADERFSAVQRSRLASSVGLLARTDDVRELARALRVYERETSEHEAALRLLELLGERAIEPLVAVLAEEDEMVARKTIVEILSARASEHTEQIGAHTSDPRWYVVRNIVTVLGAARTPRAVPYLARTARHADARVRRETIRALAGLNDRVASELLVTLLSDEDAQNVQLAARNLGAAAVERAVPALMSVARGEGKGSRDTACRIEAIEALGRIGSPEALKVLNSVAGRRSLRRSGRSREVRAAARTAASRIGVGGCAQ